jgi:hypothetical protein
MHTYISTKVRVPITITILYMDCNRKPKLTQTQVNLEVYYYELIDENFVKVLLIPPKHQHTNV